MKLTDEKEKRSEILSNLENILAVADKDNRELSEEEETEYRGLEVELEGIDSNIAKLELQEERRNKLAGEKMKAEEIAKRAAGGNASSEPTSEVRELLKQSERFDLAKSVRQAYDSKQVDGIAGEWAQEARKEAHQGGANYGLKGQISIPGAVMRAEWNRTEKRTDIDQATSAIQPTVVGRYVEAIRQEAVFSSVLPSNNILMGLTGDFKIPSVGSQSLAWATAENSAAADGGANYASTTLAPIRLTGYADVSNRVIMQNGNQAFDMVMSDFGRETANKIDAALFSTANVSNAIPSIAAASGVLTFTEASTYAAPSATVNGSVYDDYLAALQALANADSAKGALAFVGHSKLMSHLIKSPQVVGVSGAVSGLETGAPLKIMIGSIPFYLTTSNTSNGATSADFIGGDFNFQYVGFFGGLDMIVDNISSNLSDQTRIVVHRHLDASTTRGAAFVKSTTLLS